MQSFILLDSRVPDFMLNQLHELFPALQAVLLQPYERLSQPVASHPDMLTFFDAKTRSLFLFDEYYRQNSALFDQLPVNICRCKVTPSSAYPNDIALDALAVNMPSSGTPDGASVLICNRNFTANELIIASGNAIINVKQGYARCSTLVFNSRAARLAEGVSGDFDTVSGSGFIEESGSGFDKEANSGIYTGIAAVTSDRGISRALKSVGVNVLEISPGGIALPGFNCGFIGGASAVIGDTAVFFGDISSHPDGENIENFLHCHCAGCKTLSLGTSCDASRGSFPLTDFGGGTVII